MVLFFGLYWLFLRKQKLFKFNRYYLILSVIISLLAPFITFKISFNSNEINQGIMTVLQSIPEVSPLTEKITFTESDNGYSSEIAPLKKNSSLINTYNILILIYFSGLIFMLIRFCRNLFHINRKFRRSERIDHGWYKVALVDQQVSPFSFLRTIYVNKSDYLQNRISHSILSHELEHIRQSHTRDILFFEIIQIIYWFNPVLKFYNWSVRINHEYLADDAVTRNSTDIKSYSDELISFISFRSNISLTSGVSPSMIRLRLLMLNSGNNRVIKAMSIVSALFTAALLFVILSMKPDYQVKQDPSNSSKTIKTLIEEVKFRNSDFSPSKTLFIVNGRILESNEMLEAEPNQIRDIRILTGQAATDKYGKDAGDGAVELSLSGESDKASVHYIYSLTVNSGSQKAINTLVSNLYSVSVYTYPVPPSQSDKKQMRVIAIETRDHHKARGQVIQKNGKPLTGVRVAATDNPWRVRTDKDGRFMLRDVKEGGMLEFSLAGYEPVYLATSAVLFNIDLVITLVKKNRENLNSDNLAIRYVIKDFSGTWKFNKELSRTGLPEGTGYIIQIHQNDADSVRMDISITPGNNKPITRSERYVFNTVKVLVDNQEKKHTLSCSIGPGGETFTITDRIRYKKEQNKEYTRIYTYSLSDDGNRLTIRSDDSLPAGSQITAEAEYEIKVYDRI